MDDKNIRLGMAMICFLAFMTLLISAVNAPPEDAYGIVREALMGLGGLATGVAIGSTSSRP